MLTTSVLVPSYRRPDDLRRCLEALCNQHAGPAQMIVVARDVDEATHLVVHAFADRLPLELVIVSESGQIQALNAGLLRVKGEIVAITDDDAAPHSDWLARIVAHFDADSRIGGVGGRDWVHKPDGTVVDDQQRLVGRVQWFGRIVGNHHVGIGPAREVDILKGANMSFRRAAINGLCFEAHLRGQGAQVHNDMCFSLAVKRRGWKLIYDPAVAVDHYPAPRSDTDQRGAFYSEAVENAAFNLMWATKTQMSGWKKYATGYWQIWIGLQGAPGFLRGTLPWIRGDLHFRRLAASAHRGRRYAIQKLQQCTKGKCHDQKND